MIFGSRRPKETTAGTSKVSSSAYKSKLERINAKELTDKGIEFVYEPEEGTIQWLLPASLHTYKPDFWIPKKQGWIIVETKGIWDYEDRCKHAWIKMQYPGLDIRFVFSRSSASTSKGSKQTYAKICNGEGRGIFRGLTWQYADKHIPEEWLHE
jgi:hypothetical protein